MQEPTHLRLEVSGLGQLVIVLYALYVLTVCYCLYCVLYNAAFPKINKIQRTDNRSKQVPDQNITIRTQKGNLSTIGWSLLFPEGIQ